MSRPQRMLLLAALLAIATVASYAPTFSAGFVDIDDADFVSENERVQAGLEAESVAWAFREAHVANWVPLTWLSHMLDVEFFGLDPAGHHATSVALHVANALLLFGLLASVTGSIAPSFAAAAFFALHPAHVESVAWISQRKTTLSTFFGLLAIWGYARWVRGGGRGAYAFSLASFACSLLAKATLVTLPFALLLLDWWPLRRAAVGWRRLVAEKLPYAALAAAVSAATVIAQGDAIATGATFPLGVRLGNAVISYVRYLEIFLWPTQLAVYYPLYEDDVSAVRVAANAALLAAISAAALSLAWRRRYVTVGWLWFLGTLVPVIGLVQIGVQAMADRYVYAPFWGLGIALVWLVWDTLEARRAQTALRAGVAAGFVLVCGALGVLTYRQAAHWQDTMALLEDAVADTDRNYIAERALAAQYFNRGDYARALGHARAGAQHPRDLGEILPAYGMALYLTGSKSEAIATLEEATRVAPRNAMGFTNLGWVRLEEGDFARATEALAAAVALEPGNAQSHYMLATSRLRLGDLDGAEADFERVLALNPLHFDAWIGRARTLVRLGRPGDAAAVLRDAIAAAAEFPADRRDELIAALQRYLDDALAEARLRERGEAAR